MSIEQVAASHSFFCNLSAVMLKLCDPFLDPASGKAWQRLDVSYVTAGRGARVDFSQDTKFGASSEEEAAWLQNRKQLGDGEAP